MASPIPIEAPVTTTTFPASSMSAFVFPHTFEVKPRPPEPRRTIEMPQRTTTGDPVTSLLPLFPLDVVLFPGAPLPLHIFEPRYKEMSGECLAQSNVFG